MADHFSTLSDIAWLQSMYVSLAGINLFLMLMRTFKFLDFQPRVGILTRTLAKAMDDLLHFIFLLVIVLVVYAFMGYIIFGPTLEVRVPPKMCCFR